MSYLFFKDILNNFDDKVANPNNPLKWISYSAHESNIVRYARVLGLSSP